MVEDDGMTVPLSRSGVTDLVRIAGRTSLAREPGGISPARTARRATQAFLLCCHRQEGMMTTTRTRGLGASFQEPRAIACILGGAQAIASQRIFKQFAREVNAILPKLEATRPLRWSK